MFFSDKIQQTLREKIFLNNIYEYKKLWGQIWSKLMTWKNFYIYENIFEKKFLKKIHEIKIFLKKNSGRKLMPKNFT